MTQFSFAQSQEKINTFAHAVARTEGYFVKGSIPNRYNNAGDLKSLGKGRAYPGQVGIGKAGHVIFKNKAAGYAALRHQIEKMLDGTSKHYTQDMTLQQVAKSYAGNWKVWAKNMANNLGVSPSITLEEYFGLAPRVQFELQEFPLKKIYLAGPISGLTYEGAQDWRDYFTNTIDPQIACFSPLRGKEYLKMRGPLEGSYAEFPLSTDRGITSRDRNDCMGADLVVFNMLGAKRVSIGTMVEFGWADAARVPSVLIMEKEGNVHEYPMVREIASFRVDNLKDAIAISEIVLLHKRSKGGKCLQQVQNKF